LAGKGQNADSKAALTILDEQFDRMLGISRQKTLIAASAKTRFGAQ
jgi:hypothetical protein